MQLKKIILGLLISLITVYFCADFLYDPKYVVFLKPLFIPLFLVYAVLQNEKRLPIKFYLFAMFFYLGEMTLLISDVINFYLISGLIFYLLEYFSLINLVAPLSRKYDFKNAFKGYSLFVILLNCLFLGMILYLILEPVKNNFIQFIIVLNAISAILLTISAVFYLGKKYSKKALYYFSGCFAIIISDVFAALVKYYIQDFSLNFLDRVLHLTGFLLIYLFVIQNDNSEANGFKSKIT